MTACILVADGSATARIQLKVRLVAACYEVPTASNLSDFLRIVRTSRPDMILIGSDFGDLAQDELCRFARRMQALVPILCLAGEEGRVPALQAGATAVLDVSVQNPMLLARIRGLLRDTESGMDMQLAEAQASFAHAPLRESAAALPSDRCAGSRVTLVADGVARALRWRSTLRTRLDCRFDIATPEDALSAAAQGRVADLYLIAADIETRGDGLRLLSELRSRSGSRGAAFIVATAPDRHELSAIALDLGAGEVVPLTFGEGAHIDSTALAIGGQLGRKLRQDQLRAETRQTLHYAMTDPLTGLYNRRYALPRVADMARQATMSDHGFAVLILDLDRFKSINDSRGHAAGDAVLRDIAHRIETVVAGQGITCRLGGEEFMVALPRSDAAADLAEALRADIAARPVRLPHLSGGGTIPVTVSIGVAAGGAQGDGEDGDYLADLALERADRALICAKSMGRNRVMMAQREHVA